MFMRNDDILSDLNEGFVQENNESFHLTTCFHIAYVLITKNIKNSRFICFLNWTFLLFFNGEKKTKS